MPNKDWYWDRFDVDVIQSQLDLAADQTSALTEQSVEGRIDYIDVQRAQYETRFIDELYGTRDRAWDTAHGEKPTQAAYSTTSWQHSRPAISGMGAKSDEHVTWGLDLVRDWTGKEDLEFGTTDHYEWQTRGTVDWAHYYDDNAYQKAFRQYSKDKKLSETNLESWLTNKSITDRQRVDFIDWSDDNLGKEESDKGDEDLRDDWDNKYVDQFDPETAKPYTPSYLDVPDLWAAAKAKSDWETPLTPIEVVKPPSIPTLDSIKRRQVEVPDSIKNWGEAKSAPTHSFKPGGGEN